MVYLDNCATTKVKNEVLEEMLPFFVDCYGNPSSKFYDQALNAKKALEIARKRVSRLLNCSSDEIVFNSGASEGNNTVLKSIYYTNEKECNIITTKIEHDSIIETCKYLSSKNAKVLFLNVDRFGFVDVKELDELLNTNTSLVSISWVNNEIGTIQPIEQISNLCFKKNIPLHVDATQAVGKVKVDLLKLKGITYFTFSAHKIGGPKGVGVLFIRKGISLIPLIHGGSQEHGFRAGTVNVPGAVGCGKACELIYNNFDYYSNELIKKTLEFKEWIKNNFENAVINNDCNCIVPGLINVRFKGINNEVFLSAMSHHIAASTGSACSNISSSYVLREIGMDEKSITESIRFSLTYDTDLSELTKILN